MDPAELLKPINDRPIAALCTNTRMSTPYWDALISWLQDHGRSVVWVDGPPSVFVRHPDLDIRQKIYPEDIPELLFWCCLCIGPEGPILDAAREKAVPVIVADAPVVVIASRIEALWRRQDEEARELAQGNA